MSKKLKVLGVGLVAAMAMSTVAVMSASATTGGHFVSDSKTKNTWVTGFESPTSGTHKLALLAHGLGGEIVCNTSNYSTTVTGETVTQITVKPTFGGCRTATGTAGEVSVTMGTCAYIFTVRSGNQAEVEQTADLECTGSPVVEVHHPSCTITIAAQSGISGLTYTPVTESTPAGNKHAVTLDSNVQFNTQFHGGICVLLGTNHTGTLSGTATVRGFEELAGGAEGPQVNITST